VSVVIAGNSPLVVILAAPNGQWSKGGICDCVFPASRPGQHAPRSSLEHTTLDGRRRKPRGAHEHLSCAPTSHAESGTRIHAKSGGLLRINTNLPSDDQALEEVGLIGAASHRFA